MSEKNKGGGEAPLRLEREERLSRLLRICGRRLYHSSDFGRSQATVLGALLEKGPMSQKELQEQMSIQPGSMSELITKLETRGLLTRRRDGEDRRRMLLTLTEAGSAKARWMAGQSHLPVRYSRLTIEQMDGLCSLLNLVIEGWKEDGVPERELGAPGDRA